jgi:hypothetical protein
MVGARASIYTGLRWPDNGGFEELNTGRL